jgi:DNA-binding XRE family transcriptional regulator
VDREDPEQPQLDDELEAMKRNNARLMAQLAAANRQIREGAVREVAATLGERPHRPMSAEGPEQVLWAKDGTRDYVLRQVGWIGQSGAFYSLDEDPALTERGGFSPLLFTAHSDAREVGDTGQADEPQREPDDLDRLIAESMKDPRFAAAREDIQAVHAVLDAMIAVRKATTTQKKIAKLMDVKQPTVSEFESEPSDPRLSTLQRYARALGGRIAVEFRAGQVVPQQPTQPCMAHGIVGHYLRGKWCPGALPGPVGQDTTGEQQQ